MGGLAARAALQRGSGCRRAARLAGPRARRPRLGRGQRARAGMWGVAPCVGWRARGTRADSTRRASPEERLAELSVVGGAVGVGCAGDLAGGRSTSSCHGVRRRLWVRAGRRGVRRGRSRLVGPAWIAERPFRRSSGRRSSEEAMGAMSRTPRAERYAVAEDGRSRRRGRPHRSRVSPEGPAHRLHRGPKPGGRR
jgi:hypothetical protein